MTMMVLKSRYQYVEARSEMRRRRIDCTSSALQCFLLKMGIRKGIIIGDPKKSWDVLKTILFIEENLPPTASILDIGTFASEVLCALYRLNYSNLTGIDLNQKIHQMPNTDKINYVLSDFMKTPFLDASFEAVTAISVIEHGFKSHQLLAELSRILRPGGYLIASVDYWPEKIDTTGINAFGMDWIIFSQKELISFFEDAKMFNLQPVGEIDFMALDQTVEWNGRKYTFAWIVLRKII